MATLVEVHASPNALATKTGLVVIPNLDDSQIELNYEVGDLVLTHGGTYTLVKLGASQVTYIILQKGGYYTTIETV
jgi:hypothetical protein